MRIANIMDSPRVRLFMEAIGIGLLVYQLRKLFGFNHLDFRDQRLGKAVVLVGHNADMGGAQSLLMDMARWYVAGGRRVIVVLVRGGGRLDEFSRICKTIVLPWDRRSASSILTQVSGSASAVLINSVASASVLNNSHLRLLPCVAYIHERQKVLNLFAAELLLVKGACKLLIAGAKAVESDLLTMGDSGCPIIVQPGFIVPLPVDKTEESRSGVFMDYKLTHGMIVVGGGTANDRKNILGFVRICAIVCAEVDDVGFIWIGSGELMAQAVDLSTQLGVSNRIKFIESLPRTEFVRVLSVASVFTLPSLEDPFPLVCLDAASVALPIVCYADAGSMKDFVMNDAGIVVEAFDEHLFALAVIRLLRNPVQAHGMGSVACQRVRRFYAVDAAMRRIDSEIENLKHAK